MQLTALPGVLLLVLLLCCTAAVHAQAEAVDGDEQPTELAARAVFEVGGPQATQVAWGPASP